MLGFLVHLYQRAHSNFSDLRYLSVMVVVSVFMYLLNAIETFCKLILSPQSALTTLKSLFADLKTKDYHRK